MHLIKRAARSIPVGDRSTGRLLPECSARNAHGAVRYNGPPLVTAGSRLFGIARGRLVFWGITQKCVGVRASTNKRADSTLHDRNDGRLVCHPVRARRRNRHRPYYDPRAFGNTPRIHLYGRGAYRGLSRRAVYSGATCVQPFRVLPTKQGKPPDRQVGAAQLNRAPHAADRNGSNTIWRLFLRFCFVALAVLLNIPGNSFLGGGGTALAAGMSGLFPFPKFHFTILIAVAPLPLFFLFAGQAG